MKSFNKFVVLVVTLAVASFVLSAPKAFAQGYTGCDFCGGDVGGTFYDYGDIGGTYYNYDAGEIGGTYYSYPGYTDYSYPGYTDYSYPGYTDYSYPGYTDYSYPGYTDYSYPGYTDYSYPGYTDYSTYSQAPSYQGANGGTYYPSTGYSSYSSGGGYSYPSYSHSYPGVTFSAVPVGRPTGGVGGSQTQGQNQAQDQGQDQNQSQSSNNKNINNNPNTNTNINNVTVNVPQQTAQVIPVYTQPIQYPVQYTYPQQQYPIMPSCTISISGANSFGSNQLATITWSAMNASSATISPNVGPVALSGSRTVYPMGQTIYSMTVYGYNGQQATCQTSAYLPTPQVSLTQIPYTGFDFGATGNAIYWASLIAFALAASYLVVYFRGGAAVFAGSMIGGGTSKVSKDEYTMPARVVTQNVAPAVAPVAKKSLDLPVTASQKVTVDSMSIAATDSGMPRIIINRN